MKTLNHTNTEGIKLALNNIKNESFKVHVKEGGFDYLLDIYLNKINASNKWEIVVTNTENYNNCGYWFPLSEQGKKEALMVII